MALPGRTQCQALVPGGQRAGQGDRDEADRYQPLDDTVAVVGVPSERLEPVVPKDREQAESATGDREDGLDPETSAWISRCGHCHPQVKGVSTRPECLQTSSRGSRHV